MTQARRVGTLLHVRHLTWVWCRIIKCSSHIYLCTQGKNNSISCVQVAWCTAAAGFSRQLVVEGQGDTSAQTAPNKSRVDCCNEHQLNRMLLLLLQSSPPRSVPASMQSKYARSAPQLWSLLLKKALWTVSG